MMDTSSMKDMTGHINDSQMSKEEELIQMSNGQTIQENDNVKEDIHISDFERTNAEVNIYSVDSSENNVKDDIVSNNIGQFIIPEVFQILNETLDKCCKLVEACYSEQDKTVKSEDISKQESDIPIVHVPPYEFQNFQQITNASKDFPSRSCFLKGCKWSPDGTCLLTNSDDNYLRLFDLPLCLYEQNVLTDNISSLPELSAVLKVKHGGTIYDFSWFPYMTSMDPETCCFVSTSSNSPVQLWDAFTGKLRASYRGYDQYDEITAATSVTFSPSGDKIYCGYYNCVKVFYSDKPGRDSDNMNIKDVADQKGIVSCIAVNPCMTNIFAIGTYQKTVGLYSDDGSALCLLRGQTGGLTHIQFSYNGSLLYTGGRKDDDILCWDLRNLGKVLYTLQRNVTTNQRIYFDITHDGKYLVSGSSDGNVTVWDTTVDYSEDSSSVLKPTEQWTAHNDCTNGVSIHRHLPLLATCSGQRHAYDVFEDDNSSTPFSSTKENIENCVKLWWIGPKEKSKSGCLNKY